MTLALGLNSMKSEYLDQLSQPIEYHIFFHNSGKFCNIRIINGCNYLLQSTFGLLMSVPDKLVFQL